MSRAPVVGPTAAANAPIDAWVAIAAGAAQAPLQPGAGPGRARDHQRSEQTLQRPAAIRTPDPEAEPTQGAESGEAAHAQQEYPPPAAQRSASRPQGSAWR